MELGSALCSFQHTCSQALAISSGMVCVCVCVVEGGGGVPMNSCISLV